MRSTSNNGRLRAVDQRDAERFVAAFAHDLESSVLVIAKNAELLRSNGTAHGTAHDDYLGQIARSAERMQRLLGGVRNYAGAAIELDHEQVSLGAVVEEARETLAPLIDDRDARVLVPSELPIVTADRGQLGRLVQNLLSNAVKFGPPRGGVVAVTARRVDGAWRIAVSDQGPGIGREHRERIFEPFLRLRNGSHQPGTGLGLAICKRVAENHGGSLAVQTNPQGGTTFVFTLPDVADGHDRRAQVS